MLRPRPLLVTLLVLLPLVALTACSGGSTRGHDGATGTTTATAGTRPARSTTTTYAGAAPTDASADLVTVASVAEVPKLGKVLVGADGRTLYTYTGDHGSTTGCTDACAKTWPLVTTKGAARGGAGVRADELATADGDVRYFGHLLHTYSGDEFPGDVKGLQVSGWQAISPAGAAVS